MNDIVYTTKSSGDVKVLEYLPDCKARVLFLDTGNDKQIVHLGNLRKGLVKDLMCPYVQGVGMIGIGEHPCRIDGKLTKSYSFWAGMLDRIHRYSYTAYEGVIIHKDWYNYQNFAEWCTNQYNYTQEGLNLDKDLFSNPHSKMYSESTCVLLPKEINIAMLGKKCTNTSGKQGVYFNNKRKKYCVDITRYGEKTKLGYYFNSVEDAYLVYKQAKESYIRELAEVYRHRLDDRTYNALKEWVLHD